MSSLDIMIVVVFVVAGIVALVYFLNQKAYKRMSQQQEMIEKSKQLTSIFVIDKKKAKITEVNMPKVVIAQVPKYTRFMKMHFVQAKIGPQIVTLICEKRIFQGIPMKRNIKVELAGIYIVKVIGMKSAEEVKQLKKDKKQKAKDEKKKG